MEGKGEGVELGSEQRSPADHGDLVAPDNGSSRVVDGVPLKVFINYRHEDTQGTAWAVYRELKERFGAGNVFFDNGSLRSGERWLGEITSYLAQADVFISLIGQKWMSSVEEHRRRGDDDFVAKEIDLAFQAGARLTVIPVFVDNAEPPEPSHLPPNLRSLPSCHGERLRPTHLLDDIAHLIERLEEIRDSPSEVRHLPESGSREEPPTVEVNPDTSPPAQRPSAPPPDQDHYRVVVEEAENMVVFLGAGVNADDHLPDDNDLSKYLIEQAKLDPSLMDNLAEIAQRASTLRGEPRMFKWVKALLAAGSQPTPVHRYLAHFPRRLEELGLQKHYQMIITTKYDTALERAFREDHEPYDVAVYMGPRTPEDQRGRFVHIPWEGEPRVITEPNKYDQLPIAYDGELMRTVIVRINGTVDDIDAGFTWKDNYIITEDNYIDYLSGGTTEDHIPGQILAKLRESNCLFLGYAMADWRLRVFLKRIWKDEKLGRALYWAVEKDPTELERKLWHDAGAQLFATSLTDYVEGLDRFLVAHREELAV